MPEADARADIGRTAIRPSEFRWRDWRDIFIRVGGSIGTDHLSVIAAGVAFFAMLALFPAIAALVAIYGFFADPADVASRLEQIRPLVPPEAFSIIEGQVSSVISVGDPGLGLASGIALLISLWSVRAAVAAVMDGLNVVYEERERRSLFQLVITSLGLTLLLILVAIGALIAIVAIPAYLQFVDLSFVGAAFARFAPWPILALAVVLAIGIVYRYGPSRATARKRWVSLGAVVAAALWVVASLLFSFYVSNFADYNKTYGSLGAIMILLLWFYVGAFAVLLGAELNAEMELHTKRDTTTGPEQAMGQRGAFVADHVT